MFAANRLLSNDQFLCSICLDVFTDPVSTPCGHNFCRNCITELWDFRHDCQCPLCQQVFTTRPDLKVNTLVSEMVGQFRDKAQREVKPGEVPCDVCSGSKLKALKSCLTCMTSFCKTHLEPHRTASGLKRHQLVDPVENLEDRMCSEHDKPLELFCKTDQICICMLCSVLDHKTHQFVPLREEYEEKKAELGEKEAEIQQIIQKRRLKIQELKQSVDLSEESADRAIAEGVRVFTTLIEFAKKGKVQLIKIIAKERKTTEQHAKALTEELQQEICELEKKSTEVEQLSRSEDHLHLIQRVPSVKIPPPTRDWTKVNVCQPFYERTLRKAMLPPWETANGEIQKAHQAEGKAVQRYNTHITLDPDTAHPQLILSQDKKQVHHSKVQRLVSSNPKRFSTIRGVLGEQGFSSGRFYFEVQVQGKTDWTLGVASESINKKGKISLSPQNGFWTFKLKNGKKLQALDNPTHCFILKSAPERVGVFVDYEDGLITFFNAGTATRLFAFGGYRFTDKLFPFFSPCGQNVDKDGKNSAPLIIYNKNASTPPLKGVLKRKYLDSDSDSESKSGSESEIDFQSLSDSE